MAKLLRAPGGKLLRGPGGKLLTTASLQAMRDCCCGPQEICQGCWPNVEGWEIHDPITVTGIDANGWTPRTDPDCWWWWSFVEPDTISYGHCGSHEYTIDGATKEGHVGMGIESSSCHYYHDGHLIWETRTAFRVEIVWPVSATKWEVVMIWWGCLPANGNFVYNGDNIVIDPTTGDETCCSVWQSHYYYEDGVETPLPKITGVRVGITPVGHYWYNCVPEQGYACMPVADDPTADYYDIADCQAGCHATYVCDNGRCRQTQDGETAEYSDYYDCVNACSWWKCEQGSCSNGYDAESGDYQTQAECEENCGGGYYCDTYNWYCEWTDDSEQAEYQSEYECYDACHPGYVCEDNYCRETYGDEQADYGSWEECYYEGGCHESYVCDDGVCRQAQPGESGEYMYYEECQYYCENGGGYEE